MTKIVIRVLDAAGDLLGWAECVGQVPGDGCIRVEGPIDVVLDHTGVPAIVSAHWCDVNVETRHLISGAATAAGDRLMLEGIVIRVGPPAGGLPAVTARGQQRIAVPVGTLST